MGYPRGTFQGSSSSLLAKGTYQALLLTSPRHLNNPASQLLTAITFIIEFSWHKPQPWSLGGNGFEAPPQTQQLPMGEGVNGSKAPPPPFPPALTGEPATFIQAELCILYVVDIT